MIDQANALRGLMERRLSTPVDKSDSPADATSRTIAVTSGKGGVGKTNIALNLAIGLAQAGSRVCLLDANMGLGNIDLLCGLNGYWNLSHVVSGARTLKEIMLAGPENVNVIPGASGLNDVADCPASAQREILNQLEQLERTHDVIVIDTGTGIHQSVRRFLAAADVVLVVTTPEPTSIADAYATIKSISACEAPDIEALVNQADSPRQANAIIERLQQTARLFLRTKVVSAGSIPRDDSVVRAVARRKPFLIDNPHCPASIAIRQLAQRLNNKTSVRAASGTFFSRIWKRNPPQST